MKLKILFFALILGAFTACGNSGKNYVFVIDTSGSMTFQNRTIDKVKKEMPKLLDLVQIGDRITLVEFDDE
ncbi:MAG: hypothetical protein OEZ34_16690, partial [Spirochaetia bacterium]|nr:hypothetical protein [Spirochaetia bacterium]